MFAYISFLLGSRQRRGTPCGAAGARHRCDGRRAGGNGPSIVWVGPRFHFAATASTFFAAGTYTWRPFGLLPTKSRTTRPAIFSLSDAVVGLPVRCSLRLDDDLERFCLRGG
jgi:hypothetical protein